MRTCAARRVLFKLAHCALRIETFVMASREEDVQLKKTVQELRKGQLDILIRLEVVGQTFNRATCSSF